MRWGVLRLRQTTATDNVDSVSIASYPSFLEQHLSVRSPEGVEIPITRRFRDHGRLSDIQVAGSTVLHNEYEAMGRIASTRDEAGLAIFDYDGFSQLRSITRHASSEVPELESEGFRYDDRARAREALSGDRVVASFHYDLLGRIVRETRPSSATSGPTSVDRITRYLGASSLVDSLSLPSGRSFTFTCIPGRTLLDTMAAEAANVPDLAGRNSLLIDFDYSPAGEVTSAEVRSGTASLSVVQRVLDGLGRPVSESLPGRDHALTRTYALGLGLRRVTNNGTALECRDCDKPVPRGNKE